MIRAGSTVLVLIDLQQGFRDSVWGERNNFLLEANVARALSAARAMKLPVLHVRHDSHEAASPLRAGAQGFAFIKEAQPLPGEPVFTKNKHSAFIGTKLESQLRWHGWSEPVFMGLTTDHCVSTSVRMAHDLGFSPRVLTDATATFPRRAASGDWIPADFVHEAALASLGGEFAELINTDFFTHHLRRIS